MEDLIQNAHTLFDERPSPSQSPPAPSSDVVETTSTETHDSWFLSPDSNFPRSAEIQATGSTSRQRSGLVDAIPFPPPTDLNQHPQANDFRTRFHRSLVAPSPFRSLAPPPPPPHQQPNAPADGIDPHLGVEQSPKPVAVAAASTESSFSLFPSDGAVVNSLTLPQTALLSPLRGLSSTKRPTEGMETMTQERLRVTARGTKTKSPLPHSEATTIPQSPPESIPSSGSDLAHTSATSLQTRMWSP